MLWLLNLLVKAGLWIIHAMGEDMWDEAVRDGSHFVYDNAQRSFLVGKTDIHLNWNVSVMQSPAVSSLRAAVDHSLGGVLVLWAPFNTGKTHSLKDLVKIMQSEGRTAIYLNAEEDNVRKYHSSLDWLKDSIGIPSHIDWSEYFKAQGGVNRTIIVIDHFEDLLRFEDTANTVVKLGRVSYDPSTDRFRIVLAVSRSAVALQIVDWNGREKIRLACAPDAARWKNETKMREYALSLPEVDVLPESEKEEVVRMSSEGGSPGLVRHLANEEESVRPAKLDAVTSSWQKGTDALKDLSYFSRIK